MFCTGHGLDDVPHLPLRLCLVTPRYCDERSFGAFRSLASLVLLAAALDVRCFLVGGELSSGVALRPLPTPCTRSLSSGHSTHQECTVAREWKLVFLVQSLEKQVSANIKAQCFIHRDLVSAASQRALAAQCKERMADRCTDAAECTGRGTSSGAQNAFAHEGVGSGSCS